MLAWAPRFYFFAVRLSIPPSGSSASGLALGPSLPRSSEARAKSVIYKISKTRSPAGDRRITGGSRAPQSEVTTIVLAFVNRAFAWSARAGCRAIIKTLFGGLVYSRPESTSREVRGSVPVRAGAHHNATRSPRAHPGAIRSPLITLFSGSPHPRAKAKTKPASKYTEESTPHSPPLPSTPGSRARSGPSRSAPSPRCAGSRARRKP